MDLYTNYKFKPQHGCRPCNFVCDCCDQCYNRCCSGVNMVYQGEEWNYIKILCEDCYKQCATNHPCKLEIDV